MATPINQLPSYNQEIQEDDTVVQDILSQINEPKDEIDPRQQFKQRMYDEPVIQQIQHQQLPPVYPQQYNTASIVSSTNPYYNDLKLAGMVFFSVIIVYLLALDHRIDNFISFPNMPYWHVILKAIIISLGFIVIKTFVK
jgi:hypothetical protein